MIKIQKLHKTLLVAQLNCCGLNKDEIEIDILDILEKQEL